MSKDPRIDPEAFKDVISISSKSKDEQEEIFNNMKEDWVKNLPNADVECRLRINGAFGLRGGNMQVCLMTGQKWNTTIDNNSEDQVFDCLKCPDPAKRSELLEAYKGKPDCDECKVNLATKDAPKEDIPEYYKQLSKDTYDLCISCYAGVEIGRLGKKADKLQEQLQQMEKDYQDGKISYSEIVDFKEKIEKKTGSFMN